MDRRECQADAVVIGAALGGLVAGTLLARHGESSATATDTTWAAPWGQGRAQRVGGAEKVDAAQVVELSGPLFVAS